MAQSRRSSIRMPLKVPNDLLMKETGKDNQSPRKSASPNLNSMMTSMLHPALEIHTEDEDQIY